MATALPSTISMEQASEIIGIPVRTTYRAAAKGEIPCIRIGRRRLVPTMLLLDLLGLDIERAAEMLATSKSQPA